MAKYDDMSFSKAFAAARKEMGKGKTFTWKGKSYTTNLKEEEAPKKKKADSVPVPPPRPERGLPIAEMKPSSKSTQRTMSMRGRPITKTTEFAGRMQSAIDRARKKGK